MVFHKYWLCSLSPDSCVCRWCKKGKQAFGPKRCEAREGRLKMFLNLKHILPCLCCFIKHCYLQYTAWFLIIFLGDNSLLGVLSPPRPPRDFRLWLLEQQISILAWFLKDHITGAIISHSVFPRCSSSSVRTLTSIPVMLLFSIKSMWNF